MPPITTSHLSNARTSCRRDCLMRQGHDYCAPAAWILGIKRAAVGRDPNVHFDRDGKSVIFLQTMPKIGTFTPSIRGRQTLACRQMFGQSLCRDVGGQHLKCDSRMRSRNTSGPSRTRGSESGVIQPLAFQASITCLP